MSRSKTQQKMVVFQLDLDFVYFVRKKILNQKFDEIYFYEYENYECVSPVAKNLFFFS